jgi:hypothetical protein
MENAQCVDVSTVVDGLVSSCCGSISREAFQYLHLQLDTSPVPLYTVNPFVPSERKRSSAADPHKSARIESKGPAYTTMENQRGKPGLYYKHQAKNKSVCFRGMQFQVLNRGVRR